MLKLRCIAQRDPIKATPADVVMPPQEVDDDISALRGSFDLRAGLHRFGFSPKTGTSRFGCSNHGFLVWFLVRVRVAELATQRCL